VTRATETGTRTGAGTVTDTMSRPQAAPQEEAAHPARPGAPEQPGPGVPAGPPQPASPQPALPESGAAVSRTGPRAGERAEAAGPEAPAEEASGRREQASPVSGASARTVSRTGGQAAGPEAAAGQWGQASPDSRPRAGASARTFAPGGTGHAIVTRGLTKRFRGGQVAVDGVDLAVPAGSVFGFLGPNGSGKTTTIRMLLGLIAPTAGEWELLGVPMPAGRARALPRVGAVVEGPAFYPYLTGEANLRRYDAADPTADPATARERIGAALERVGLAAAARKRYRAYSLGMRQRLAIAAALLGPRDLLVLDEPTNGLDPQGTREVRALVRDIAADGTTVFVSSHLLAEVEQMCTHVGVMRSGRLVAQGEIADLLGSGAGRVRVETGDPEWAAKVLDSLGLTDVRVAGEEVTADAGTMLPEDVIAVLVCQDVAVRSFTVVKPSLEDVFVGLTGEGFDVEG
jgi:ABC-2 type transport system ATP-binding protein